MVGFLGNRFHTAATAVTEYLDETVMNWDQVENKFVPMNHQQTPIAEGLKVQVLPPERLKIEARLGSDAWNPFSAGDWRVRAEIRAVFLSPPKKGEVMVIAYVARPVHMLRRLAGGSLAAAEARVIDPERKMELPSVWAGDRVFFNARVTRPSQQRFFVYFSPSGGSETATEDTYMRFQKSPANLVPRSAGVSIPPISVAPNAKYLYAAWLRTDGLVEDGFPKQSGTLDLRGRFLTAEGKPGKNLKTFEAMRSITGTTPWTLRASMVETPPDCASFEITLPKDPHATEDRILLAPVTEGVVTETRAAESDVSREAVAIWVVNPMVKVFPDDPPLPGGSIATSLARNEWEPAQLAMRSRSDLKNVQVKFDSVRNNAGAELPVHAYKVVSVPVDRPTAYYQTFVPVWCRKVPKGPGASDGWAGEWPDALPPLKPFDLASDRTQPLWFEIYAPRDAAPGEYRGTIRIEAESMTAQEIPFTATVWNFTLPKTEHMRAVYDLLSGPGWDVTEGDNPQVLRKWYTIYAEHRMCPDTVHPEPKFTYKNGKVHMDAKVFDEMGRVYFDELGMNHAYTPQLFYAFGWATPIPPIFGLQPHTPQYDKALQDAYRIYIDHVTTLGWRDKIVYYVSDEPFLDDDRVVKDLRYEINLAKAVAPDVPIYSSTWRHSDKLDGYLTPKSGVKTQMFMLAAV
jgi:hypothetical protein